MFSNPASHPDSVEKFESMKEILHGKTFPPHSDSCPLKIEMTHFPIVRERRRTSSTQRRKSITRQVEAVSLPSLQCQHVFDYNSQYLHMNAEQELRELDSSYSPCKTKQDKFDEKFDFTGPSACETNFSCFRQRSFEVTLEREDEKVQESHALKRWSYWMRDKKRMQEYLSKRLQRSFQDLLLQDSDKIRKDLEEKWLSTCTQIPEPDKWRGHPSRWKAEFRLPNRKIKWNDPKEGVNPQYCAIRTSLDKGEVPEMEFIGIPKTIQLEKGLSLKNRIYGKQRDLMEPGSPYYTSRKKKLKPHEIDMDGLEVIGKKLLQPEVIPKTKSTETLLPEITIEDTDGLHKREEDPCVFCLMIGDTQIKYEIRSFKSQVPTKAFHLQVDFALNTVGCLAERELRVENRGTVAIRYHWLSKKPQRPMNLEKLQPRQYEPWFFFNKNSGFFLPGQVYNMKFYHLSKFSGIRKEVWNLKTEPPLSLNPESCTITLSAIATEEFSSEAPMEKYLFNRVKVSIIETIIEIILDKVLRPNSVRGIEYRSLFSRKILFEYNNPTRYYNSTIVDGLNKIYEEITPGLADWDLSLDTLVRQVRARRIGKDRNSLLSQIAEKAKLLMKPTYVSVSQDKKYRMTYAILCKMTNSMEEDYYFFRTSVSQKIPSGLRKQRKSRDEKSAASTETEEIGEFYYYNLDLEINPVNLMFFKTMFYLKVYYRMCQAVEHIAGVMETAKLFEPWNKRNCRPEKPHRSHEEHPYIVKCRKFE